MNHRKSKIALIALGAALAMPLAFAQDASTPTADPAAQQGQTTGADASTQGQASSMQQGAATTTGEAAAPGADAKKVTWADLDGDKDGKITKAEAAPLQSLSQIFDQADGDADGALTADEYKAYLAKSGQGQTPAGSGG